MGGEIKYLHVLDVLPVPDGLEAHVGEAEDEQVHHELLAQVVVDPVDLVLSEHRELAHHQDGGELIGG